MDWAYGEDRRRRHALSRRKDQPRHALQSGQALLSERRRGAEGARRLSPHEKVSAVSDHLLPYPLTPKTVHLCLDMQRLFSTEGPWPTPWMTRVLPLIEELVGRHPERTVFTRFMTPNKARDMPGMWQRYYARWNQTTREYLDPA